MVPFLCRWAGGPEVYKFLAAQLESGSKQASPGFGSRFLPQFLLGYTYKPQFVVMDLKVPDCGFNHSHITVDFYLQKDKTFVGWGKDGFWGESTENKNGIIRKWKAKNKHVMLGPQDGVETDPILWLSVRVPRIPGGVEMKRFI